MSNYQPRRAPNVSQYLANLNTIPSAQELAAHQQNQLDFNESDLDFLTNAEFFDFDQFNPVAQPPQGPLPGDGGVDGAQKGMGVNGAQYPQFNEFQAYPPTVASTPTSLHGPYSQQSPTNGLNTYPNTTGATPPQLGDKRKPGAPGVPTAADLEEQSRLAAEEDKRRRNTAASARFRVKKKQREQALEKQAKEMADKVSLLEGKVQQLEMENKWLKGLITDKGGEKMPEMEKVGMKGVGEKEAEERSTESVKRGIGTADDEEDDKEDEE